MEEQPMLVRGNSYARVSHRELQLHAFVSRGTTLDLNKHFSVLGKLDGVTYKVYQDLTNPPGISDQFRFSFRTQIAG